MPQFDSARSTYKLKGKKTVAIPPTESKKWRPKGCEPWFANIGTPTPSVYPTSRPSARAGTSRTRASTGRKSTRRSHVSTARPETHRSAAQQEKEMMSLTSAQLWDKKLQLERQLDAIREEQETLMCDQIAKLNYLTFHRKQKKGD